MSLADLRKKWLVPGAAPLRQLVISSNVLARQSPFDSTGTKRTRDEWVLTEMKLPQASLPSGQGRGRTFEVRKVSDKLVELADALLLAVNSDAKSSTSIFETFKSFEKLNPKMSRDVCLLLFLVDIVSQGIKASSAITYGRQILGAISRTGEILKSPLIGDAFRILDLISADEDTEHAIDISEEDAWWIIGRMRGEQRLLAFLMVCTGIRCKDQEHILCSDLLFEASGKMTLYFRWTKNHRRSKERYSIVVQPKEFIPELLDALAAGPQQRLFPRALAVGELNSALKLAVVDRPELAEVTSYSLRRRFIHAIIQEKTEGAVTRWVEVAALTGHYDLEVLRNSYAPRFSNTL
jgi:hypothetical protein